MKEKTKKKKAWLKYFYLILTLGVIVAICFASPEQINFAQIFRAISPWWLLGTLALMGGFWVLDTLQLSYITRKVYKPYNFLKAFKVGLIGQYYAALTPSATGGQPAQAIYMKRGGIPVGYSTSILTIKFLGYETALCILYFASMVVRGATIYQDFNAVFWLSILGLVINIFVILVVVLLVIKKQWVVWLADKIVSLLHKLRVVKDKQNTSENIGNTLAEFSQCIAFVRKNPASVVMLLLITIAHFICYFSISYFLYRGFGYNQYSYMDILPFQIFLYVTVSLVPTPGATGANETGFPLFLGHFFPGTAVIAMLCWRLITYYSNIVVGGLVILGDVMMPKRRRKRLPSDE